MFVGLGRQQLIETGEKFLAGGIVRPKKNPASRARRDPACSQNVQGDIHAHRAGMKKVQGPDVERAACQVGAARRGGDDCIILC